VAMDNPGIAIDRAFKFLSAIFKARLNPSQKSCSKSSEGYFRSRMWIT
jgi:hypothetical protein